MVCPEHLACALIFRILSNILVVKGGIGPILQVRKIRSRELPMKQASPKAGVPAKNLVTTRFLAIAR